jgi:hypothetical protein
VTIAPSAKAYLDHLAEDEPEAWTRVVTAICSLQSDPEPAEGQIVGAVDRTAIELDSQQIGFSLDHDLHQVHVVSIEGEQESTA